MSAYNEPDGSLTVPVNAYKDIHLLKFIVPGLVYDRPGLHVFVPEKGSERGKVLTFLQSKSGYNIFSVEGLGQVLSLLDLQGTWWVKFLKKDYASPEEMLRTFAFYRVLDAAPPTAVEEDEFVADLLLLPPVERVARARLRDPGRLLYSTVKVMHSFLNRASYATYKPRYREKLLTLASRFAPNKKALLQLDLDFEDPETSLYLLLLQFT